MLRGVHRAVTVVKPQCEVDRSEVTRTDLTDFELAASVFRAPIGLLPDCQRYGSYRAVARSSATERAMRLLRSELQPLWAWRCRLSGWRLKLRPCDCWLPRATTVRGLG